MGTNNNGTPFQFPASSNCVKGVINFGKMLSALFCAALVGCFGVSTYDSVKRQPTTSIDIFRDGEKPSRHYKEIALFTDDGHIDEQPNIEGRFIKKAKDLGGNAIVFYPLIRSGGDNQPFGGWKDTFYYKATVLVYEN